MSILGCTPQLSIVPSQSKKSVSKEKNAGHNRPVFKPDNTGNGFLGRGPVGRGYLNTLLYYAAFIWPTKHRDSHLAASINDRQRYSCTMAGRYLEQGFTLPEVMLALTFSSLIALAAAKILPVLRQHTVEVGRHYRLEMVLRQLAGGIEKDLRRSGFCAGQCQGQPLLISHMTGEAAGSCVIVAYDLNRNGRWEKHGDAEYFGYRLRAGALEGQRGVTHCHGAGWERLLDQEEVRITAFSIRQIKQSDGGALLLMSMSGRSTAQQNIQRRLEWAIGVGGP